MKLLKLGLSLFLGVFLLTACQDKKQADLVTTSFVAYDIARAIAQDNLTITNITPWGTELHDFDPSPQDIMAASEAGLFIYTSDDLESWASSVSNKNVLNLSQAIEEDHHDHDHEEGHNHASHFWTDPLTFVTMIELSLDKLIEIYPEHQELFKKNAGAYIEEIKNLTHDLEDFLTDFENPTLFFAGHNALDGFADHFGLSIIALQDSYRPNADVTAQEIVTLRDEMKSHNARVLFHEELVTPLLAQQIKEDLAKQGMIIELLELHGYHNITQEQFNQGVSLSDLFKQNIINIKEALGN